MSSLAKSNVLACLLLFSSHTSQAAKGEVALMFESSFLSTSRYSQGSISTKSQSRLEVYPLSAYFSARFPVSEQTKRPPSVPHLRIPLRCGIPKSGRLRHRACLAGRRARLQERSRGVCTDEEVIADQIKRAQSLFLSTPG